MKWPIITFILFAYVNTQNCYPECYWNCDTNKSSCNTICSTYCEEPVCNITCLNSNPSECGSFDCKTLCAETQCVIGQCPLCGTYCTVELICNDCGVTCDEPICGWNCVEPDLSLCPLPTCKLECESPSYCACEPNESNNYCVNESAEMDINPYTIIIVFMLIFSI